MEKEIDLWAGSIKKIVKGQESRVDTGILPGGPQWILHSKFVPLLRLLATVYTYEDPCKYSLKITRCS